MYYITLLLITRVPPAAAPSLSPDIKPTPRSLNVVACIAQPQQALAFQAPSQQLLPASLSPPSHIFLHPSILPVQVIISMAKMSKTKTPSSPKSKKKPTKAAQQVTRVKGHTMIMD